jgi:hypothetical protein
MGNNQHHQPANAAQVFPIKLEQTGKIAGQISDEAAMQTMPQL